MVDRTDIIDSIDSTFTTNDLSTQANELLDLVDENDVVIGVVSRVETERNPQLIHREVAIIIYDAKLRVLLQKRSANKSIYPRYWTTSCMGHVPRGMDPELAAHKELREEFGFDVTLSFLGKIRGQRECETCFSHWYLGRYNGEPIIIEPQEIEKAKFVTKEQFEADLTSDAPYEPDSVEMLRQFWCYHCRGELETTVEFQP